MTTPQNILLLTLGNRDLQLLPGQMVQAQLLNTHFESGNIDTQQNFVIKKSDSKFFEHSQAIWEHYDDLQGAVDFPMVKKTIAEVGSKPDEIVLITTSQNPPDRQDCHFVALFLKRHLTEQGFQVSYTPITFPPVNLAELMDFFSNLYNRYANQQIYFGNSGGTPDMRAATHMAGMFRKIQFLTIQARDQSNTAQNFLKQERTVLKHIVSKMLDNFDYAGILKLPLDEPQIAALAQYALARIHLDFQQAQELSQKLGIVALQLPTEQTHRDLEIEMFQSARIKLRQEAYADFLWRLFTISEKLYFPYVELLLGGKIVHNAKDEHQAWMKLLEQHEGLIPFLEEQTINKKKLVFSDPNIYAFEKILKFFENQGDWTPPTLLENTKKALDQLRSLRNNIMHDYKGINREFMEKAIQIKALPNPRLDALVSLMANYLGVYLDDFGVYTKVNHLIEHAL